MTIEQLVAWFFTADQYTAPENNQNNEVIETTQINLGTFFQK